MDVVIHERERDSPWDMTPKQPPNHRRLRRRTNSRRRTSQPFPDVARTRRPRTTLRIFRETRAPWAEWWPLREPTSQAQHTTSPILFHIFFFSFLVFFFVVDAAVQAQLPLPAQGLHQWALPACQQGVCGPAEWPARGALLRPSSIVLHLAGCPGMLRKHHAASATPFCQFVYKSVCFRNMVPKLSKYA